MREIKFSYILQHDETGRIVDKRYDIEDIENFEFIDEPHGYTLVVRRQFTGLLDKNGVEIHEGDVVKSNSHKPTTFKIEFIEGGFCATQTEHNYPLDINHFYPSTGCIIEVIGNIFQHPHLLEANHD